MNQPLIPVKRLLVFLAFVCLGLAGCASSGPNISAAQSPGVDLTGFQTFNYLPRLGTDRSSGARTTLSNRLIEAMNHEMSVRGLRLSDRPDLMVDFSFFSRQNVQIRQSPNMGGSMTRSHWGRSYGVWGGYSTRVSQYSEGTLLIDLIDVENASLIAEGAAQGRTISDMNSLDQAEINGIVADVMAQLWP